MAGGCTSWPGKTTTGRGRADTGSPSTRTKEACGSHGVTSWLGAFLPSLFPARVRYTGASMAFNVGGIIGGGLAPMLAQILADRGGLVPVGLYLGGAALVSLVALAPLRRTIED